MFGGFLPELATKPNKSAKNATVTHLPPETVTPETLWPVPIAAASHLPFETVAASLHSRSIAPAAPPPCSGRVFSQVRRVHGERVHHPFTGRRAPRCRAMKTVCLSVANYPRSVQTSLFMRIRVRPVNSNASDGHTNCTGSNFQCRLLGEVWKVPCTL